MGLLEEMDKGLKDAYNDVSSRVKKMEIDKKVKKEADYASKKFKETAEKVELDKKINQAGESFTSAGKNMSSEINQMFNKNKKDTSKEEK